MPANMAVHNICADSSSIPHGYVLALGLGPKFCIKRSHPTNDYRKSLARFKRSIRIKYQFLGKPDGNYIPGLYIPNTEWTPRKASSDIELCLKRFESKLRQQQKRYQRCYSSPNILKLQATALEQLCNNEKYIVVLADKNLGFVVLERDVYIRRVLSEHLCTGQTYKQLTAQQAHCKKAEILYKFERYIGKYFPFNEDDEEPDPVAVFMRRALHRDRNNIAQFRSTIKIHKLPWKLRPVITKIGTYIKAVSKWLDKTLFELTQFFPTIVRDSQQLRDKLVQLVLPPNARIFTTDAIGMYQNISTDHGIQVMK